MAFAFSTPGLSSGMGATEETVHPASGLRTSIQSGVFANSDRCIVSSRAIANTTTWTVLPLSTSTTNPLLAPQYSEWGADQHTGLITGAPEVWRPLRIRLPFACTPCVTYRQMHATPANNQTFSIRVSGWDQFGMPCQETIENVASLPAGEPAPGTPAYYGRKTRLWLSKVFSVILRVEYQAANVQGTSDFIDVGVHWDWDFSGNRAPYETYIAQQNQGVGTPYRIAPNASSLTSTISGTGPSFYGPELLGLTLTQLDGQAAPILDFVEGQEGFTLATALSYDITAITVANPTQITLDAAHGFATGQRFIVRIVDASNTPNINGEWIATANGATTFLIPVNVTVVNVGIARAYIPGFVGPSDEDVPVIISGVSGPADPTLLNGMHWVRMSDRITGDMAIAAVTGTGGVAQLMYMPTAHVQAYDPLWNPEVDLPARGGFVLGQQLPGYEGTPHKWGIYKSYAGESDGIVGMLNGNALLEASFGVDSEGIRQHFPWRRGSHVGFQAHFRSMLGTFRGSVTQSSYRQ